jgi:hypothetical protein
MLRLPTSPPQRLFLESAAFVAEEKDAMRCAELRTGAEFCRALAMSARTMAKNSFGEDALGVLV